MPALVAVLMLIPSAVSAAILQVPLEDTNVLTAYAATVPGDIIEIQPGLYPEGPPVKFESGKPVIFRPASGRVVVTPNVRPANDDLAAATLRSGSSILIQAFNYTATLELNEHLPAAAMNDPANLGRSLWWQWTAPMEGLVIASTVGSDTNAVLDVFARSGNTNDFLPSGDRKWYRPNEVGFQAHAGMTYYLVTGGDRGAYGQITLNLNYVTPPSNDHRTNALPVGGSSVISGATFGATAEAGETNHAPWRAATRFGLSGPPPPVIPCRRILWWSVRWGATSIRCGPRTRTLPPAP